MLQKWTLLGSLFTIWMVSTFIFISMLLMIVFSSTLRWPAALLLIMYYGYRHLNPFQPWPAVIEYYRDVNEKFPYFRKQQVIFEDTKPIARDSKTMLAFHPHGVLCCAWMVNLCLNTAFPVDRFKWLVTDVLFSVPGVGDMSAWLNAEPVGRKNFERLVQNDQNIALIPGGFEEATIFQRGEHRVYLKQRKGFIKMALKYGYQIVPAYTFGEELTFKSFSYFLLLRLYINRFKLPTVVFQGFSWCYYLPFNNIDLNTIIGKPIVMPKIENPTKEEVDKYHTLYLEALQSIFERNKAKYAADPNSKLHVY